MREVYLLAAAARFWDWIAQLEMECPISVGRIHSHEDKRRPAASRTCLCVPVFSCLYVVLYITPDQAILYVITNAASLIIIIIILSIDLLLCLQLQGSSTCTWHISKQISRPSRRMFAAASRC